MEPSKDIHENKSRFTHGKSSPQTEFMTMLNFPLYIYVQNAKENIFCLLSFFWLPGLLSNFREGWRASKQTTLRWLRIERKTFLIYLAARVCYTRPSRGKKVFDLAPSGFFFGISLAEKHNDEFSMVIHPRICNFPPFVLKAHIIRAKLCMRVGSSIREKTITPGEFAPVFDVRRFRSPREFAIN